MTTLKRVNDSCSTLLLAWLIIGIAATPALGAGFRVKRAQTHYENGVILLNADIAYDLSDPAQKALNNSVPLTLVLRLQVRKKGWLWDEVIADLHQQFRLKYHALAQQYIVTNLNSNTLHSFPTRRSALGFIGRLRDFPLLDQSLIDDEFSYYGRIRAELDIESLPAPLRPVAYLSEKWRLASEWYQWPL